MFHSCGNSFGLYFGNYPIHVVVVVVVVVVVTTIVVCFTFIFERERKRERESGKPKTFALVLLLAVLFGDVADRAVGFLIIPDHGRVAPDRV